MKTRYLLYAILSFFIGNLNAMQLVQKNEGRKSLPDNGAALAAVKTIITTTGTTQLQNRADIPVIKRELEALSNKSESSKEIISDITIADSMIHLLAHRFSMSPFNAAAYLDTPGTREWTEKNLAPEQFMAFKAVQHIILSADIAHARSNTHAERIWPQPNPQLKQTASGLLVAPGKSMLISPWGGFAIVGGVGECQDGNMLSSDIKVSIYDRIGTCYQVDTVNGESLPAAKICKDEQRYSHIASLFIWSVLDDRYKREIDPHHITTAAIIAERANRISARCNPQGVNELYPLSSMQEFPQWVTQLLRASCEPNESLTQYSSTNPKKVTFGCGHKDGFILQAVLETLNTPQPQLFSLSTNDRDGSSIELYGKTIPAEFFDVNKYTEITAELTTGWQPCNLVDHPDLLYQESEADHTLYTKKINQENIQDSSFAYLFNDLVQKLNLFNKVYTFQKRTDVYSSSGVELKYLDVIYLWIRKNAFEEVVAKMNLTLENPPSNN